MNALSAEHPKPYSAEMHNSWAMRLMKHLISVSNISWTFTKVLFRQQKIEVFRHIIIVVFVIIHFTINFCAIMFSNVYCCLMSTFERASLALPSMACTSRRLPWATAAWSASIFCMYLVAIKHKLSPSYINRLICNVFLKVLWYIPWDCLQELADFCIGRILW